MSTDLNSLFRLSTPSLADLESFHNDGYIAFPDVFTDQARESLIKEIEGLDQVREYVQQLESHRGEPKSYFIRPWNERGPYSDQLIDDPFIASLLRTTIGDEYHYCHSALNIAPRGIGPLRFHQDHHHWKHENPVNHAERDKYYVQILYYLNGFTLGDRNLKIIPGSHLVAPTEDATPDRMLAGEFDARGRSPTPRETTRVAAGQHGLHQRPHFPCRRTEATGLLATLSNFQYRYL